MHRPHLRLTAPRHATLVATLLIGLTTTAGAFIDTHLDEITAPLGDYATTRVAEIEALPSQDKATKKERKLLLKLTKKTARPAKSLKSDFGELVFGGKTAKKLKDAAEPMGDALDESFLRALIALGERREFVGDHVAIVTDAKSLQKIQKKIDAYNQARSDATSATDDLTRAKALAKAEKSITAALKRAEKDAQNAVNNSTTGLTMPLVRLRSGDTVGAGGARIAVPVDADSPVAGASVLIPSGAVSQPRTITIEPGDSFVTGRDSPAGPSVRFLPAGVTFNQPLSVSVPFLLPPDVDPNDIALFHKTGAEITATLDVTIEGNGALTGTATSFSEFQAGILAPPLGAPAGTYHVQMLFVSHVVSPNGSKASEENLGVTAQDWSFRADGSGRRDPGNAPIVFRGFTASSPHHIDGFSPGLVGSVDYEWSLVEAGRFSFDFPTEFGGTATAEGIVSESGDVISFTGRGGPFEFIGVGVRDDITASNADLDGRWLAVELGIEMVGSGQTPFTTRFVSSYTSFDADGENGTLTFSGNGSSFVSDRTFAPGSVGTHSVSTSAAADGGEESFTVFPNGQVQGDQFRRAGVIHPEAGIFVSTHADQHARSVVMMVAVRQPAAVSSETFRGDFRIARLDVTPREDTSDVFRSFLDVDPAVGTFHVSALGEAAVAVEPVERAAYLLEAAPFSGAAADWRSSVTLGDATPGEDRFDLALDAAGNDTSAGAMRWYGVSGDGRILLGSSQSSSDLRSLVIGLK